MLTDGSWIYSISTQFATGSVGRQIPWLTLLFLALPPVFLPKGMTDDKGSAKREYEALPMIETTRPSGDEESEEEDFDHFETLKASGIDV